MPYTSPYTIDYSPNHTGALSTEYTRKALPPAPYGYKYEEIRVFYDPTEGEWKVRGRYEFDPEQK